MTSRSNKRDGHCNTCGGLVPAGTGDLWWEPGPDDGGDVVGRTPAGWRVSHARRGLCAAEIGARATARAVETSARALAAKERKAAEDEALAAQQREIDRLLAEIPDCVCAGYDWDSDLVDYGSAERVSFVRLDLPENPAIAGISLGRSNWTRYRTKDGSPAYVHSFGNANVLYATRAVVEKAWANYPNPKHYGDAAWIDSAYSPEALEKWLVEFGPEAPHKVKAKAEGAPHWISGPCAGWQQRAYRAGRLDLLVSEGVLPDLGLATR